jgi:hypothetical protein
MKKVVALLFVTVSLSVFSAEVKTGENIGLASCDKVSQAARKEGKAVQGQSKGSSTSTSATAKSY